MKKSLLFSIFVLILLSSIIVSCSIKPNNATCKHDDPTKIEIVLAKAPTCQDVGLTEGMRCLLCGTMVVPQANIDKTHCVESDWIIDNTQNEIRYTKCIYCDQIIKIDNSFIEVLPGGKNFERLNLDGMSLPENILNAYVETNGNGYVFEINSQGYASGLVIRVGIDTNGKIAGSKVISSNEIYGQEESLNGVYNGKDLNTLELILAAGATPQSATSKGYYSAIEIALKAYTIISGGKLAPKILFEEMLPTLHSGLINGERIKCDDVPASGSIVKGWKSINTTGAAYIMSKGENMYLVLVNNANYAEVYDVDKNNVTAYHKDLATEALINYGNVSDELSVATRKKIDNIFGEEASNSADRIEYKSFGSVSVAAKFSFNSENIYMFQSKPLTFGDNVMVVYTFVNEDGRIIKQDTSNLIYEDFYSLEGYMDNEDQAFVEWLNKYIGRGEENLDDELLISGATISSTAVKNATKDVFDAFKSIKNSDD